MIITPPLDSCAEVTRRDEGRYGILSICGEDQIPVPCYALMHYAEQPASLHADERRGRRLIICIG